MIKAPRAALAALTALLMAAAPAACAFAAEATVNAGVLNVRKKASAKAERVARVKNGETVTVADVEGDWSLIEFDSQTGYVLSRYLTASAEPEEVKAAEPVPAQPVINVILTLEHTRSLYAMGYQAGDHVQMAFEEGSVTVVVPDSLMAPPALLGAKTVDKDVRLVFGDEGELVRQLQTGLSMLGFYDKEASGVFDEDTRSALVQLQLYYSYAITGWADASLYEMITANVEKPENIDPNALPDRPFGDGAEPVPWATVSKLWKKGSVATVVDVLTGKEFKVKRWSGREHADIEPLTAADTAIMKSIYGGSWSWRRRAVAVLIDGKLIAGSMNGMPHGVQTILDNDFEGQFCIHFLGSKVHASNQVDPDHQTMIRYAAGQ